MSNSPFWFLKWNCIRCFVKRWFISLSFLNCFAQMELGHWFFYLFCELLQLTSTPSLLQILLNVWEIMCGFDRCIKSHMNFFVYECSETSLWSFMGCNFVYPGIIASAYLPGRSSTPSFRFMNSGWKPKLKWKMRVDTVSTSFVLETDMTILEANGSGLLVFVCAVICWSWIEQIGEQIFSRHCWSHTYSLVFLHWCSTCSGDYRTLQNHCLLSEF